MSRHERRHSFDGTNMAYRDCAQQDEYCNSQNASRRVHFDDERISYNTNPANFCYKESQLRQPQLTVHEVTAKLKHSYENISHGLDVLGGVSQDLAGMKEYLGCNRGNSKFKRENLSEVNRLLSEVEHLQAALQRAGNRKRKYLEELSRLQTTLHSDRKKMESWVRSSRESKDKIQCKLDESSRLTRDQQILIHKLKNDNNSLWKILQEIQNHLKEEDTNVCRLFDSSSSDTCKESSKQRLILPTPKLSCDAYDFTCDAYPVSDQTSSASFQNGRRGSDGGSSTSSQEQYLADKLKQLLEQSKNIQKLISKVGDNKTSHENKCKYKSTDMCQSNELSKRCWTDSCCKMKEFEGNEKSSQCDKNEIIRRCEELERKVEECSTKDIRERIMQQLHEIDSSSSIISNENPPCCKKDQWCESSAHRALVNCQSDQHQDVREELLGCLDRIVCMENNYKNAQNEVQRLRQYIKETSSEKEKFEQETMETRRVIDMQSKQIESMRINLQDALKELKRSESMFDRITELEQTLEEKNTEISFLRTHSGLGAIQLKSTLNEKSLELEKLKSEMRSALEVMEKMRTGREARDETHIQDELSLLQVAINHIEHQMQLVQDESTAYRVNAEMKQTLFEELESEHEELINRLKLNEEETLFLRRRLETINKEVNFSSIHEKDDQIRRLESDLKRLLEERTYEMKYGRDSNGDRFKEQEDLVSTLIDDNNKYLELIQHKDNTIDGLRQDLNDLANALEKRLMREQTESSEDGRDGQEVEGNDQENGNEEEETEEETDAEPDSEAVGADFSHELNTIKQMVGVSHSDITEKVLSLHKDLAKLKDENRSLRKHLNHSKPSLFERSQHLQNENEDLKSENATLRDTLNRPYPGIVENILTQGREITNLKGENDLLRLALGDDKKGLVDSNLRKRVRIKELEQKLDEGQSNRSSQEKRSEPKESYRRSNSQGKAHSCSKIKANRDAASRDVSPREPNPPGERFIDAMMKQNDIIGKLQADNDKLRGRQADMKASMNQMESEMNRLQKKEKANEILENELLSLRTALKEMSEDNDLTVCKKRINELENEVQRLQNIGDNFDDTMEDGITPTGSPVRSKLSLDSFKGPKGLARIKNLLTENSQLRSDLDKAHHDLNRAAKIAEKAKNSSSADQAQKNKMKKLEGKIQNLKDDNFALKDNMQDLQRTNNDADSELMYLKTEVENLNIDKTHANDEIQKLRAFIKSLHNQKSEEHDPIEMIDAMNDTIDELQKQKEVIEEKLARANSEKVKLAREVSNLKANNTAAADKKLREIEKEKKELEQKLSNTTKELTNMRDQNKELEDISHQLADELEKVRNDISETHFADWLEQDVDRRLALLSPESHRSDNNGDGKERTDHRRVIRKLQIENQILRAKLSSLEDEAAGTTKIIADMERGHGHLTGTLRCHLILQKNGTGKLLESSLQQYSGDFEILKRNFKSLEEKYDKEKKFSKRRDHAWDLFSNACATMDNIQTILNEGLVKVEDDIERELTDQEFEDKDYKSRLWILRRRLSDVENRHRELQLRAEELNLRLDAKTTEYEVTQDELQDTTRDLETRETSLQSLKNELKNLSQENSKLKALILSLKDNQDKTVGTVLRENDELQKAANNRDNKIKTIESDADDMMAKLDEKDAALNIMKRMRENAEKEIEVLKNRIQILERKLADMTAQRDKLKKEAENRAGYMGNCHDDHGTIHMLRDDIKRISKENANLKQDVLLKQRQMYDMSKDLHKMKMQHDLDSSLGKQDKRFSLKDEIGAKMILDLAELKAQKFVLETRLEDIERRKESKDHIVDQFVEDAFKNKLIEKEREIERLKRERTFTKSLKSPNTTRDDTMSDISPSVFDSFSDNKNLRDLKRQVHKLRSDNDFLRDVIDQKDLGNQADSERKRRANEKLVEQQQAELESLGTEVNKKQKKIKELLKTIEELQDGKIGKLSKDRVTKLIEKTKEEEMKTLTKNLDKKEKEVEEWKRKAEGNEKELQRMKTTQSAMSNDDDKFQNLYLNRMTPTRSGATPNESYQDTPKTAVNTYGKPSTPLITPKSYRNTDSGFATTPKDNVGKKNVVMEQPGYTATDLIDLDEPFYEELMPYEVMLPDTQKESKNVSADTAKKSQIPVMGSKIPVTPSKRKRLPEPVERELSGGYSGYEEPVERKAKSKEGKRAASATKKKTSQVISIELFIHDELDLYRRNVGVTEHDTLQTLGRDALNSLIDYQIYTRHVDDINQLQSDIDELRAENEMLKERLQEINFTDEKDFFSSEFEKEDGNFTESEVQALKVKLDIKTDENNTLKELLETQSQNIKSQEAVIRTLKKDITDNKARHVHFKEISSKQTKEKKTENRDLKKQIKDDAKSFEQEKNKWKQKLKQTQEMLKTEEEKVRNGAKVIEDFEAEVYSLRSKLNMNLKYADQEIGTLNKSLTSESMSVEKLRSEMEESKKLLQQKDDIIEKLKENLSTKDETYQNVLTNAESALEEAKLKLTQQDKEMEELTKTIEKISKEKLNQQQVFEDVKIELKNAVQGKNEIIDNIRKEFEDFKLSTKEEEERLKKEIERLELQCNEYQLILEDSQSTTSEISKLKEELSKTKSSYEEMKQQQQDKQQQIAQLQKQNDLLSHTNDLLSEEKSTFIESSLQTDPIDETDHFDGNMELEIEYEIVKGCNEELEKEIEGLQEKMKRFEEEKQGNDEEVQRVKDDLGKTLEYLRELSEENEKLKERKTNDEELFTALEKENKKLKSKIEMLSEEDDEILKLKDDLRNANALIEKHGQTIEEMEIIMDQLEGEVKSRDKIIESERLGYTEHMKDCESVITELEGEINSKNRIIENEKSKYDEKFQELKTVVTDLEHKIQMKDANYKEAVLYNSKAREILEISFQAIQEQQNEEIFQLNNNINDLTNKYNWLKFERDEKTKEINSLKHSLDEWIQKSANQTKEMSRIQDELVSGREIPSADENADTSFLSNQVNILKAEIGSKNVLVKNLQREVEDKEDQHKKILSALNKRRDESKIFIAMQNKMQNELDNKEDFIRKLMFKLKSNALDVTDASIDLSDHSVEDIEVDLERVEIETVSLDDREKNKMIEDQAHALNLLSDLLSSTRQRNNHLKTDLENCRTRCLQVKKEKAWCEEKNESLKSELEEMKEKLHELRTLVQESPNASFGDENKAIGMKSKLYSAYKELREKSVEIATLKMSMEIKDLELESLEKELRQHDNKDYSLVERHQSSHSLKCNHSNDVKSLVRELDERAENERVLQEQLDELRNSLMDKTKHCDYLQNEIVKVVGKFKDVEKQLLEEDKSLKEKFLYGADDTSDLSEITPLTTNSFSTAFVNEDTITPTVVGINECSNETYLIDDSVITENTEQKKQSNQNKINELEDVNLQREEEILYFIAENTDLRNQIKSTANENQELKKENDELKEEHEIKMEELMRQILKMEDALTMKEDEIKRLGQTTVTMTSDNTNAMKEVTLELSRFKNDNTLLKGKLAMQAKRHEVEMEHLKSTLLNLKAEHVFSLKNDFEQTCKDKLTYQVKLKTMEEKLNENQQKIERLLLENESLRERMIKSQNKNGS